VSRFDNIGLWWEDRPPERKQTGLQVVRSVPPPATGWLPPKEFPNLTSAKVIGLDTETKDLEMNERGPGAVRGKAHAVGVSVAVDGQAWYFPFAHEYGAQRELNLDRGKVLEWLNDLFAHPIPVVGANLMYDLEVLQYEGVRLPAGPLFDIQFAEPLIDEESRHGYSLDALGRRYLEQGKDTSLLYQWCADCFGGKADESQRANIWRAPPTLVGPYAEADALLPLQVLAKQRPLLATDNLTDLFRMECDLIPLLLAMRRRGVRIDLGKAEQTAHWLRAEAAKAQLVIPGVDVWSNDSVAAAFDKAGVDYPRTEAGNPSFRRPWLENSDQALARAVLQVRSFEKAANPFVESYILEGHHNGRLHCQFHPLRGDLYGTVTGRFSSNSPNLQNIPARNPVIGPMLRSLFIPEEGCTWLRGDHSQIEYRLLVHYAVGKGAEELRRRYNEDSSVNFHRLTQEMVKTYTGVELEYKASKNFNFGLCYGMGKEKIMRTLDVPMDLAERLYNAYFEALPSVKKTYQSAQRLASRRGYIKTILGRRRRFTGDDPGVHKALNACLQGGAADILKKGMLDCWNAGLFGDDACGVPHLTVHDELDFSKAPGREAAFAACQRIMETCVKLRVPMGFAMSEGVNWGSCE
jgi:DNA polymerase I-like protein with 3'-5' exonuclease and polymerase domains